ncbi:cysteine proteinase [Infundibulicybe gibba]|nr:cysteine proteinase [Infundibulicybe gibba]
MAADQCPHIATILPAEGDKANNTILKKYTSVVAWNVHHLQSLRCSTKRKKVAAPICGSCSISLPRPFVCLHCTYSGCWSNGHILGHLNESEHIFCADAKTGAIFCSKCDDFIYDSIVDRMNLSSVIAAEERHTRFQVSKKPREPFVKWALTPMNKPFWTNQLLFRVKVITPTSLIGAFLTATGRRGLLNLGQTCFLNVVLQCFAHNPLLRNYFLGDKHNWRQCKLDNCTCCEMDKLFTEIYSDDTSPYAVGYAQQDAHEFFISALNQIHTTSRGSTNVSCNCIIHSTFAGQLQSDVKCERCGNVTSTVDPMLDISLELKGKGNEVVSENTLAACLRRFTQPEKLGPKEYSCAKCGKSSSHEASKRLSVRKLPPVLSFQLKRFEHKISDKTSARKIDTPIRFPASLNMAPYTTLVMKEAEKGSSGSDYTSFGPDVMYEYDLFAVINHEGQINNGHYTNFARFQDEWYRFDDDKVTHSNLGACLNSTAYMCFYAKRHLDYKPYMTPTYVTSREIEAAREKKMEKEKEALG